MTICHVIPALDQGGMESFVIALAGRTQRSVQTEIICTSHEGALLDRAVTQGVPVTLVLSRTLANIWAPTLRAALSLRSCGVIHSHSGAWGKAAAACRPRTTAIRHIHTMHGFHEARQALHRAIERMSVASTDMVVAVSQELADYASRELRVKDQNLCVIPNGVDTDRFHLRTPERRARTVAGAVQIGFVGRLTDVKNPIYLLRAFDEARRRLKCQSGGREVHLNFFGDGPLRSELDRLAGELGVADAVSMHGSTKDIANALQFLDIFCLPSRSEGTSIALLEAMASGLPVVATAVGGTTQVIDDKRSGFLVPSTEVRALAERLVQLVEQPDLREALGNEARLVANARYSLAGTVERYRELYQC